MSRYLGIDYGDARIGIAISDERRKIAFPLKVLEKQKFFREIKKLIEEEKIVKIIIGLPFSSSGAETPQSQKTREFAEKLKNKAGIPIDFQNEILTTRVAEKNSSREKADASSAALILQDYLDRKLFK